MLHSIGQFIVDHALAFRVAGPLIAGGVPWLIHRGTMRRIRAVLTDAVIVR